MSSRYRIRALSLRRLFIIFYWGSKSFSEGPYSRIPLRSHWPFWLIPTFKEAVIRKTRFSWLMYANHPSTWDWVYCCLIGVLSPRKKAGQISWSPVSRQCGSEEKRGCTGWAGTEIQPGRVWPWQERVFSVLELKWNKLLSASNWILFSSIWLLKKQTKQAKKTPSHDS